MADIEATQGFVLAATNEPSEFAEGTQALAQVAVDANGNTIEATQAYTLVAVRGAVDDPSVRAWTFTLDGHDFYVLRLGNTETLVYDTHSDQWYVWGSADGDIWNVYSGINWVRGGDRFSEEYGSNVLVGSDGNGALFLLDPDGDLDDSALTGTANQRAFDRVVTTQIPVRTYDRFGCYEVQLLGSIGDLTDASLTSIELTYSDDRGASYTSAGTVTTPSGDLDARATWRSLGSFRSPGRIFQFKDTGALRRIDSITMNSDLGDGS